MMQMKTGLAMRHLGRYLGRHLALASAAIVIAGPVVSPQASAQTSPSTQAAQSSAPDLSRRVDVIERELRAVQRRVFPGSDNGLFQPEVQPANGAAPAAPGGSSPVADLNARVDAIETALARMTEQVEQTSFRQRELEASITRLRTELSGRVDRLEASAAAAAPADAEGASAAPTAAVAPAPGSRPAANAVTATPATTPPASRPATNRPVANAPAAATPAAPTAANAERRTRVAAIEVPSTGNAPEDAYLYGYRLWEARLYPEAQAQLQKVVADHPQHRRASYAGNLLGRAYLDNNQPTLAVRAFYDNYRTRPRGERAPDSVYFMGIALIRLDRRPDACRTFDEFDRAYGATASAQLKAQVATAREQARC